jgi:hypothetical protein
VSAGGWCPKHDKVFESSSGRCPECGTTLVTLGAAPAAPAGPIHEEILVREPEAAAAEPATAAPASSGRAWVVRGVVAASIAGAFALGIVFPRTEPDAVSTKAVRPAKLALHPRQIVATNVGSLRLDRVVQNGKDFVAEFAVFHGLGPPGSIEGAAVEVTVRSGAGGTSSFGLSDVKLVTGATGFTISGTLEVADERVVEIRLVTVEVLGDETPTWTADISGIWPVGAAEPKILRIAQPARQVGEGSVRLTGLLGWKDRLEAVFEMRGAGTSSDVRYSLNTIQLLIAGDDPLVATGEEQVSPSQIIVRFTRVPRDAARIDVVATRVLHFLTGPWTFRLE